MTRFRVPRLVLVTATAMLAALLPAVPASANHAWNGYHWARTANPFTISLGDNVDASWRAYLATAASDWSADTAGNPLNAAVATGAARSSRACRPENGRVEVCNSRYGYTGWLGVATIWIGTGGHIVKGNAKMNDTYLRSMSSAAHGQVMCQEVGHTFGLDHQDETGADLNTCMDYGDALDNPHPNQHDYDQLAAIYRHLDDVTTTNEGMAGNPGARPSRVDRENHGNHTVITKHYPDGSKKVSFIHWAS